MQMAACEHVFTPTVITINRLNDFLCTRLHCELYNSADICFGSYIRHITATFPC